ncbi:MAG: Transposase DDE domain protein [Actinobacteria bacterium ADurb.BinA094]|jgi:transposase|nr:MAG: Transposase DDE domain protein [Actinobacteria bacterium ADurb.BinA094]
MRGDEQRQAGFIVLTSLEDRVPADHPLRTVRKMVDAALEEMSPQLGVLYASRGRPSIAPEYLLRAQLIQILYAIPSERRLVEHLEYNLLLRWFVGLPLDQPVFHATSFTKNRDRLLASEVAEAFFCAIRSQAASHKLLSREHFSLDGTLLEAAASLKSLRPIERDDDDEAPPPPGGRNPEVDWRGERRGNATHRSRTDPEARLARKGNSQAAKLCYAGHSLTENRNGLIVGCELTEASGSCEREAGLRLLRRQRRRSGRARMSVGADRGYDVREFVAGVRELRITPHVACKKRASAIDGRTTRHAGYAVSQRRRKTVEEPFGWMKTVGGLHKLRHRGRGKASAIFTFACAAYNLVRLRTLLAEPASA